MSKKQTKAENEHAGELASTATEPAMRAEVENRSEAGNNAQEPAVAAAVVQSETAPGDFQAELQALNAKLGEKDREIAELKDKYLRALAEAENSRKRLRQQSEETMRLQRENLLRDLLPMVDNLERAVEAARGGGNGKPIVEGVEMVLRSMLDFLRNQGVTPLTVVGARFDPERHEAVEHVETKKYLPNTVIDEFHRGYQIGERVLRPARVSVAKGPSGDSQRNNGEDGPPNVEKD